MNTGPFIAHETILYCPQHGEIHRSKDLQRLVPFNLTVNSQSTYSQLL